jgi:hypothetical protein
MGLDSAPPPCQGSEDERRVHLYYHSSQWLLHFDVNPALNYDNQMGYCRVWTMAALVCSTKSLAAICMQHQVNSVCII